MTTVMRTDSFASLLDTPLRRVFFLEDTAPASEYKEWCNEFSLDRNNIDDYEIAGLGPVPTKAEGGSIQFDRATGHNTKNWYTTPFASGFIITREMWDDDLHNVMRRMTQALRRAVNHTYEREAYSNLNNPTATAAPYAGFGGEALLSSSHSIVGTGATYSNVPSSATDISYTAVQAAMISVAGLVNRRGLPEVKTLQRAVVSINDMFNAAEIFKNGPMEFGTQNNNKNFVLDGPMGNGFSGVTFSRYFDDTDAWFLLPAKSDHDISLVERVGPEFNTDDDFYTMNTLVRTYFRIGKGHSDWRGVYGSLGNGGSV